MVAGFRPDSAGLWCFSVWQRCLDDYFCGGSDCIAGLPWQGRKAGRAAMDRCRDLCGRRTASDGENGILLNPAALYYALYVYGSIRCMADVCVRHWVCGKKDFP